MREIKIPQQDFALKIQGGAYVCVWGGGGGGHICGTLRYSLIIDKPQTLHNSESL